MSTIRQVGVQNRVRRPVPPKVIKKHVRWLERQLSDVDSDLDARSYDL